ncbi:hypothetical protein GCM10027168_21130 [Streptomyces capparidis]
MLGQQPGSGGLAEGERAGLLGQEGRVGTVMATPTTFPVPSRAARRVSTSTAMRISARGYGAWTAA